MAHILRLSEFKSVKRQPGSGQKGYDFWRRRSRIQNLKGNAKPTIVQPGHCRWWKIYTPHWYKIGRINHTNRVRLMGLIGADRQFNPASSEPKWAEIHPRTNARQLKRMKLFPTQPKTKAHMTLRKISHINQTNRDNLMGLIGTNRQFNYASFETRQAEIHARTNARWPIRSKLFLKQHEITDT